MIDLTKQITVKYGDEEFEVRIVRLGDLAAAREQLRRQRLNALPPNAGAEVIARTCAQPVEQIEVIEWLLAWDGVAWLLERNCEALDADKAEAIARDGGEEISRYFIESGLLAEKAADPTGSRPLTSA